MKLAMHGTSILEIEVTNISSHGFWLFINDKEYFLSFFNFPWFKKATFESIINVVLVNGSHLFWESLDVDLDIKILEHPEDFPLISK